ncbi:DUF6959 family protein [Prosthecodimorpha hirschii]|uniref:DUF6959 family protein n=1 Tax=Prosthecodimorpha hirschii TaxID=665126 RepID=UPI001129292A|nr:hypothetical protein [Prosthecomicrobium hirschii]
MKATVDMYTPGWNFAVIKLENRAFPGIVFQGDSTAGIYRDLQSLDRLLAEGKCDEAREELGDILEKFNDILLMYERILSENGFDLPYTERK